MLCSEKSAEATPLTINVIYGRCGAQIFIGIGAFIAPEIFKVVIG